MVFELDWGDHPTAKIGNRSRKDDDGNCLRGIPDDRQEPTARVGRWALANASNVQINMSTIDDQHTSQRDPGDPEAEQEMRSWMPRFLKDPAQANVIDPSSPRSRGRVRTAKAVRHRVSGITIRRRRPEA